MPCSFSFNDKYRVPVDVTKTINMCYKMDGMSFLFEAFIGVVLDKVVGFAIVRGSGNILTALCLKTMEYICVRTKISFFVLQFKRISPISIPGLCTLHVFFGVYIITLLLVYYVNPGDQKTTLFC